MIQEAIAVRHPHLVFGPYIDQNISASQTNAQLVLGAAADHDGVLMPLAGYVVGIAIQLNAAATAGSLTVGVSVDGTEDADTTQTITTGQEAYALFPIASGVAPRFAAGQQIGVEVTTSADWDGTTADLAVWVYVVLENFEV